jgi:lipopolysaccharide transport system permease protein
LAKQTLSRNKKASFYVNRDKYELIIKTTKNWFVLDWRGLLHYRDLLLLLAKRDFVARYKQTILGPLWFIIQPLATTLVFTIIFFKVAKVSTDSIPPILFYFCGLLVWNYFASCLNSASLSLIENANLFGKVYFPRILIPLSTTISNLASF